MDNSTDWIELIDRYFEWKQGDPATDFKIVNSWEFKYIAPPEVLGYYVKKSLEVRHRCDGGLIDFVAEDLLTQIAETAIRFLEMKVIGEFAVIIQRISLHHPEVLHPYLDRLFDLILERDDKYHNFRWCVRGAWRGATQVNRLFTILKDSEQPDEIRRSAWVCLMNTCNPTTMREAIHEVETGNLTLQYEYLLKNTIEDLGFEWDENNLRQLYQEAGYHLIFPEEYISMHEYRMDLQHPTYSLDTHDAVRLPFGGQLTNRCWRCGNPLSHVLTLSSELTKTLPIHSRESVEFAVCLTCMLEELFYQHDQFGKATSIPYGKKEVTFTGRTIPRNPHLLLFYAIGAGRARTWGRGKRWKLIGWKWPGFMKTQVAIVPTPKRWQWQYGDHENLHRLGGHPTWIQTAQYPLCPKCSKKMIFVMQIKDQLPLANGREQYWGDVGIGYFYWCDDCAISGFISQST